MASTTPSIPPVPPLAAIQDPVVKTCLQPLVDGWNVRNGITGGGNDRFVTLGELTGGTSSSSTTRVSAGGKIVATTPGQGGGASGGSVLDTLIANALKAATNSTLYKKLGEQIQVIQTPEWFQGKFGAAIQTEQTLRQEADLAVVQQTTTAIANIQNNVALVQDQITAQSDATSALAQKVTTVQATAGNAQALAQQSMSAVSTINGTIQSEWTVKTEVTTGGDTYVAGVGLMTDSAGTGGIRSEFAVRCDRFTIGPATTYDASGKPITTAESPFVVYNVTYTDPATGARTPPGVYMKNACIQNAAVGTLKIAGHAVTVTQTANRDATMATALNLGDNPVLTISVAVPAGETYTFLANVGVSLENLSATTPGILLWVDVPGSVGYAGVRAPAWANTVSNLTTSATFDLYNGSATTANYTIRAMVTTASGTGWGWTGQTVKIDSAYLNIQTAKR